MRSFDPQGLGLTDEVYASVHLIVGGELCLWGSRTGVDRLMDILLWLRTMD